MIGPGFDKKCSIGRSFSPFLVSKFRQLEFLCNKLCEFRVLCFGRGFVGRFLAKLRVGLANRIKLSEKQEEFELFFYHQALSFESVRIEVVSDEDYYY